MREYTPGQKIEQARLALVRDFPFYGSVFFRLNVHEDDTCRTAWTDGQSLGYNPTWLGQWEVIQIVGVFGHEVLHVVLKHHLREELNPVYKKHHQKFNRAADYALNPIIHNEVGMELPPNCLLDLNKYPDNLVEQIFADLPDLPECPNCGGTGEIMPGSGQSGKGTPCPCQDGMIGEVRPLPGKDGKAATKAEKDQASNQVDQWVHAASMKGNNAGRMSAGAKKIVKDVTTPTVHWEDELQFLCEEMTRDDYTWTRPNSRYIQAGVYLPSLHGEKCQDLLFFVDTSGSLDSNQLAQIMAEVRKIVSTFHIRVIVAYWDTKFKSLEVFDEEDVIDPTWRLNAVGRGGTRFGKVLDWMDDELPDQEIDPAAVVFFTDLECSDYPDREPDIPWLWAQVPDYHGTFNHSYIKHMPEWGRHVTVPIYKRGSS